MKIATGSYINIFSENGYHNCNLSYKFDIFICFIECFKLTPDVVETLELLINKNLSELGEEDPNADEDTVYMIIRDVLDKLDYEYSKISVEMSK